MWAGLSFSWHWEPEIANGSQGMWSTIVASGSERVKIHADLAFHVRLGQLGVPQTRQFSSATDKSIFNFQLVANDVTANHCHYEKYTSWLFVKNATNITRLLAIINGAKLTATMLCSTMFSVLASFLAY